MPAITSALRRAIAATGGRHTFSGEGVTMDMDPFVRRLVDAYSQDSLEDFDNLLREDVVLVRDEEKAHGREEFKGVLRRLRRAFPDIKYRVDDSIVAGDKIVLRWNASGTHRGDYLGVPATGRAVSYTGITMFQREGDRIARIWVAADLLSLLRRLREMRADAAPEQPRA
jgi:steroid delta-isomerase-like uncharacterized protein